MDDEALAELRAAVARVLGDRIDVGAGARELSPDLLGNAATRLGALGYLDAGDPVDEGGLGVAADFVVVSETARYWGALAVALTPRLLAGYALGRGAVTGTDPLDWGVGLRAGALTGEPVDDETPVINGPSARTVLLGGGLLRVGGWRSGPEQVRFEGFHGLAVSMGSALTPARSGFARPATEVAAVWRLLLAAVAIGLTRAAVEDAVAYAVQRRQFHRPIATFGEIRSILATAAVQLSTVERTMAAVGAELRRTRPRVVEAAKVLALAVDIAVEVTNRCQHVHGGYGQMAEFPIGRIARDARTLTGWADPLPVLTELVADDLRLPGQD